MAAGLSSPSATRRRQRQLTPDPFGQNRPPLRRLPLRRGTRQFNPGSRCGSALWSRASAASANLIDGRHAGADQRIGRPRTPNQSANGSPPCPKLRGPRGCAAAAAVLEFASVSETDQPLAKSAATTAGASVTCIAEVSSPKAHDSVASCLNQATVGYRGSAGLLFACGDWFLRGGVNRRDAPRPERPP